MSIQRDLSCKDLSNCSHLSDTMGQANKIQKSTKAAKEKIGQAAISSLVVIWRLHTTKFGAFDLETVR